MTEVLTKTRTLEVIAAEIHTFTASMLNNVIEIGRRLCEAKEMMPYGEFGKWVKENTAYSVSSANNFMRLFNEYGAAQGSLFGAETESQTLGKLSYSKALALLAVPAEEREAFAERVDAEHLSSRELQEAIRERDEARSEANNTAVKLAEAENELAAAKETIQYMSDQGEVQKRIDAAVADALKEAEKTAAAERKTLEGKIAAAEKGLKESQAVAERFRKASEEKDAVIEKQKAEGITSIEKERLTREIEDLKKQLAMSDTAVTGFRTILGEWVGLYEQLLRRLDELPDRETAARLRAALGKQLEAFGEKVKG